MLEPLLKLGPDDAATTIIFLHGLTGTAHSVRPVAEYLLKRLPEGSWRFVLPTASKKIVHQLGEIPVHAWFDIRSADLEKGSDTGGLEQAGIEVSSLLHEVMAQGTHPQDIYLGGFSQGGEVSLVTALSFDYALRGIFALSSFLPSAEDLRNSFTLASRSTPIFFGYGTHDEIISEEVQKTTIDYLQKRGNPFTLRAYDIRHEIKSRELDDLAQWLGNKLS